VDPPAVVRLFIAAVTGPIIERAAAHVIDQLRRRASERAPRARVTWNAPERIHITVRFIGQADDDRARLVAAALESPLPIDPFELTVAGLGVFPSHGRPRVIWAGVTAGREAMLDVERQISSRLDPILGRGEERGYTPHLTLARVRDAAGLTRRVCDGLESTVLGTTTIDGVTLFESRMSATGSTYVPLLRTNLRSGPSTE
jgi:2'-5' RNA ligase